MTQEESGAQMTTGPYGDAPYGSSPYGDATPGPAAYPGPSQPPAGYQQPGHAAAPYPPAFYPATSYPQVAPAPSAYPPSYYAAAHPRNGLGTAALVLGIIGAALFWTISLPFILGILAIIFGAVGLGRVRRGVANNRGVAMTGLILGIVAVLAPLVIIIFGALIFAGATSPFWGI